MPSVRDFRVELFNRFQEAQNKGEAFVVVNAGDLHRTVGGYPDYDHRMPTCCAVLQAARELQDEIVVAPPKGRGASLTVRYRLPRQGCPKH